MSVLQVVDHRTPDPSEAPSLAFAGSALPIANSAPADLGALEAAGPED